MLILLTNDDGIYAPGLAAIEHALSRLGEVYVVAPASEQSGVGHSITYLSPLTAKETHVDGKHWGWAVEGTPADCVKLGVSEFLPRRPDLIVSGINGGLNAGINVLYSGTMAAAIEGAFFGIPSVAVSLEFAENAPFEQAAELAVRVIERTLQEKERTGSDARLFNLNIPLAALDGEPRVRIAAMDVKQYWERLERRTDPGGRAYYWVTGGPTPQQRDVEQTDISVLSEGCVSLTPLTFDMTDRSTCEAMGGWNFDVSSTADDAKDDDRPGPRGPDIRSTRT
jgi:5'-nucleotidase